MKFFVAVVATICIVNISSVSAREVKPSLSLQAVYAVPIDYLYNSAGNGYGGGATLYYNVDESLSLTGHIAYMVHGAGIERQYTTYNLSVIPINVGILYKLSNSAVTPYIGFGAGMFLAKTTVKVEYMGISQEASESSSDVGITPLFGIMIPFGALSIDATAKYNVIFLDGGTTSYIGIQAGVNIPL